MSRPVEPPAREISGFDPGISCVDLRYIQTSRLSTLIEHFQRSWVGAGRVHTQGDADVESFKHGYDYVTIRLVGARGGITGGGRVVMRGMHVLVKEREVGDNETRVEGEAGREILKRINADTVWAVTAVLGCRGLESGAGTRQGEERGGRWHD